MNKYAIILAGGKGTRLWPLSRENYPKQFVEFKDNLSLFQLTLKRLINIFPPEDIFIISQGSYAFTIDNQIEFLPGLKNDIKKYLKKNVIFEPVSKNTLPALLLSIKYIETRLALKDNDLIYLFPSDHIIEPMATFKKCMEKGRVLAEKNKIVVFGLKATSPKKGYGYILAKKRFQSGYLVNRFIEKPSFRKAKALLKKSAFWNAGIFCFSKFTFLKELQKFRKSIYKYYGLSYKDLQKRFKNIPSISVDYGIMQDTKNAALVEFNLKWSDMGSWDSFLQYFSDGKKNFNIGKAEFLDSKDCFAYSRNRLMCLVGLKDIIAIDSPDSLLLIKKGSSDNVKELVSIINKKGYVQSKDSSTVYRPWGYYTVLHETKNYKVKEIGIYPKKSVSLQKHKYRSEHWNIVEGKISVFINGQEKEALKNESIFVPRGIRHRVTNPTNKISKIIEVQIGSYVGEDDIVRFSRYE